jgi:hypothetical protein
MTERGNARFLSDELFHLVGRKHPEDDKANFQILQSILREERIRCSGYVEGTSGTSLTVFPNRQLASGEMFVATCTCYADIPLLSIPFHAAKYGRFGLSFHRDLLIRRGARPVIYIPTRGDDATSVHGATLLNDMQVAYNAFRKRFVDPIRDGARNRRRLLGSEPQSDERTIDTLHTTLALHFLAFVKPYDSQLPVDHQDYFYSEREWRITNFLRFIPNEVERVIVATENDKAALSREFRQYRDKILVFAAL